MFHATFFASEVLVGALAVDLMLSVINPFVSYKQTTRRTLVFCFLFTVFTTALIIAWDAIGPTDFGFCWIKCSKRGTVNLHRSVTLYAPLLTIWIICCTSLLFAWWRLRRGLKRTLQTRRQVLKSLSIYVFGYLLYYAVLVTIYGVVFFFLDDKWLQHKGANTALLLLLGGRGTWHLIAWMVSRGWRDIGILKNTAVANDADYDYSPQLNRALRKEVLYYTKKGMRGEPQTRPAGAFVARAHRTTPPQKTYTVKVTRYEPHRITPRKIYTKKRRRCEPQRTTPSRRKYMKKKTRHEIQTRPTSEVV